jgi:hypothetical protein
MSRGELGHKGGLPVQKFLQRTSWTDGFGDEILDFHYELQEFTVLFLSSAALLFETQTGIFLPMNFPIIQGMSRFCVVAPLR